MTSTVQVEAYLEDVWFPVVPGSGHDYYDFYSFTRINPKPVLKVCIGDLIRVSSVAEPIIVTNIFKYPQKTASKPRKLSMCAVNLNPTTRGEEAENLEVHCSTIIDSLGSVKDNDPKLWLKLVQFLKGNSQQLELSIIETWNSLSNAQKDEKRKQLSADEIHKHFKRSLEVSQIEAQGIVDLLHGKKEPDSKPKTPSNCTNSTTKQIQLFGNNPSTSAKRKPNELALVEVPKSKRQDTSTRKSAPGVILHSKEEIEQMMMMMMNEETNNNSNTTSTSTSSNNSNSSNNTGNEKLPRMIVSETDLWLQSYPSALRDEEEYFSCTIFTKDKTQKQTHSINLGIIIDAFISGIRRDAVVVSIIKNVITRENKFGILVLEENKTISSSGTPSTASTTTSIKFTFDYIDPMNVFGTLNIEKNRLLKYREAVEQFLSSSPLNEMKREVILHWKTWNMKQRADFRLKALIETLLVPNTNQQQQQQQNVSSISIVATDHENELVNQLKEKEKRLSEQLNETQSRFESINNELIQMKEKEKSKTEKALKQQLVAESSIPIDEIIAEHRSTLERIQAGLARYSILLEKIILS